MSASDAPNPPIAPLIPRPVWVLGFVSLLMDVSSEMVHGLLPVYLVGVLGASAAMVGIIEGVAEAIASITKVYSGMLSDWLRHRKWLAAAGYGLSACVKPVFPLAGNVAWVAGARFLDRVGKGIRGAPRDALIADLTAPEHRGRAYGLRQSLDTAGAFAGPLLAIVLMRATGGNFQAVFWAAVLPGMLAFALIALAVREPPRIAAAQPPVAPWSHQGLSRLPRAYWRVVLLGVVFTLARFSEAFLLLRGHQAGISAAWIPVVLMGMNLAYMLSAYPAGLLSDTLGRFGLLAAGMLLLLASHALLALEGGLGMLAAGVALWGLHLGCTQGLLAALLADLLPADLRGTGFGFFNLATGLALLAASLLAGVLWDRLGSAAPFAAGAGFTLAALTLLPGLAAACRAQPRSL